MEQRISSNQRVQKFLNHLGLVQFVKRQERVMSPSSACYILSGSHWMSATMMIAMRSILRRLKGEC